MSYQSFTKFNSSLKLYSSGHLKDIQQGNDYEVNQDQLTYLDYLGINFQSNPQRRHQFKKLFSSILQTSLFMVLEWIPSLVQLYFIGQLGIEAEISGFGMGLVWSNCFAVGVFGGLGIGVETLASFSFGAKKYKMTGIFFQRGIVIVTLFMFPIAILMFLSYECLKVLTDNEEISYQSSLYCKYGIFAFYFSGIYNIFKGFLIASNEYQLPLIAVSVSTTASFFLNYFFIYFLQLGVVGAAVARTFVEFLNIFVVLKQCIKKNIHNKFDMHISKAAFKEWGHFLKFVIPIGSLLTLEWLSYELFTMQAARLDVFQFNAHVIMNNVNTIYYQFGYSTSIALTTYVGNEMGSKCINKAQDYAKQGLTIVFGFLITTQIPFYFLKQPFVRLFTPDPNTIDVLDDNFSLFQLLMCMDSILASVTGITRGIGKQNLAATSFIVSYLFIGQIIAYFLTFICNIGIKGIWIGTIFGICCTGSIQVLVMYKSDWKQLLEKIQQDIEREEQKNKEMFQQEEMLEEKLGIHE